MDITSLNLIALVVTQIPLDNQTISPDLIVNSARPPWIRPARKKNSSAPRSAGSVESPPQDISEFVGSTLSTAPASTPFGLSTSISVAPTQSQSEFPVGTLSPFEQLLDPAGTGTEARASCQGLPSAELMALFGDGGLDVAGLFPRLVVPGVTIDRPSVARYGGVHARHGSQGSDEMTGLEGSP